MSVLKVLGYLNTAIAVAKIVEAEVPEGTPGDQKLEKAIEAMTTLDASVKDMATPLSALFTIIVRTLNVLGVFKKKPAA